MRVGTVLVAREAIENLIERLGIAQGDGEDITRTKLIAQFAVSLRNALPERQNKVQFASREKQGWRGIQPRKKK
jgi:hypothetical protein